MFLQVSNPLRKASIGKQTSTRRRGKLLDSELCGELKLTIASPPTDIKHVIFIYPALSDRQGIFEEFLTQRPDQQILISAKLSHHIQRSLALTHRPLSHHLTGDDEIRPQLLEHLTGKAKHQAMTIDARIDILPKAIDGIFHHLNVFGRNITHDEVYAVIKSGFQRTLSGHIWCRKIHGIDGITQFFHVFYYQ